MESQEMERFILGLKSAGWDAQRINDFLLYIANGDEQYMPRPTEEA